MELSIFLAKLFGIYLVVVCLAVLIKRKEIAGMIDGFFNDRAMVFFSGALVFIMGLLVVLSHNIWEANWRGVVTFIGWLTVFKGLLRLFWPNAGRSLAHKVVPNAWYTIVLVIFLAVGVWLTFVGFTA